MALMVVEDLCKDFGGLRAVDGLSFTIEEGQIKSMIGPNGSGKTTTVNLITRTEKADQGSVRFLGSEIINHPAYGIAGLGITRTFQEAHTFNDLTVIENVVLGRYSKTKSGLLDAVLRTSRRKKEERESLASAHEALHRLGIQSLADEPVGNLSLVNRRWVEIARAIVSKPKLLILDEPAAGLDAGEINELVKHIYRIKDEGVTVFLIEHHLPVVMGISDHVIVLDFGRKIAEGSPKEISTNEQVIAAYLGDGASEPS